MSMVINLVEDHNIYLCEGGPVYNGGVQPTPITYLTQWKIVGNSEVHTLPYPDGIVLPTGYTRCKYLGFSNGTSYFDSGIIPEQGIELHAKYMISQNSYITGARTGAFSRDSFYILIGGSPASYQVSYGGKILDSNSEGKPSIEYDTLIEVTLTSQTFRLNNYTKNVETTIIKGSKNIYIGAVNGLSSNSGLLKIYEYSLSLNNAVIFNGIPCLDDNNVPCLYDTVSQTTLYNQGTGTLGYELYPQPIEIWSCGEYNATDGKYHILVQPQGGSIADIALTEPLRKVNDVADTIEFPSETEGKALVTRPLYSIDASSFKGGMALNNDQVHYRYIITVTDKKGGSPIVLTTGYTTAKNPYASQDKGISCGVGATNKSISFYNDNYCQSNSADAFRASLQGNELIYELATPTTELVDAPQIEEADSYTCEISPGAKAISWSSFETE